MYSHKSVLENEIAALFSEAPLTTFCDATLGLGGHTLRLLQEHPEAKKWVGLDQDEEALEMAKSRLSDYKEKVEFQKVNFNKANLPKNTFDGILADLGISSLQLDKGSRGFSFQGKGPLDMRMDRDNLLTAEIIINDWSEEEIARILKVYGEEKQAKKIASLIAKSRKNERITTTDRLVALLMPYLGYKKKGHHPLTLTFQALRIAVNQELEVLVHFLPKALAALKAGGRLVIISFHSLEDRIVKQYFQEEASDKVSSSGIGGLFIDKIPGVRILTPKPIVPSDQEVKENPRSRSAKLRAIEKIGASL